MDNLWSGDYLYATNSHLGEEPLSFPKISKVWSIKNNVNNPQNQLTPQIDIDDVMQRGQPLRVKVQLPDRPSFLANDVKQLELVLQYGDKEEQALMIDIHSYMEELELPNIKQEEEPEIPISDNSYASTTSFLVFLPSISNHGGEGLVESLENPLPPPRKKITTRRRKMKESTTCKICHKEFTNKSRAAEHSLVHLSLEEKEATRQGWKNKCYFCAKRFPTPSRLNLHLVVHTKEKPHPCDKCGKRFNQNANLTRHRRLHNPATRPFKCDKCGMSFYRNSHLSRHVTMVHLRLKQFQCPECDQKFGQKSDLTRHRNSVHLGIRYPCRRPHCGKSFTEKKTLRKHEKRAH